ncbi:hypothetical protein EsH8_I_000210 [Colletotrichum jinshuiense]
MMVNPAIGYFHPDADTRRHRTNPIFTDNGVTVHREVETWTQGVNPYTADLGEAYQLCSNIHLYLRGAARNWWDFQLLDSEKNNLRAKGWAAIRERIRLRFGPSLADAEKWFQEHHFTMAMIHSDRDLRSFAQDCFKYARAWGDLQPRQWLTRFYRNLAPIFRQFLHEPTATDTIDSFLTLAEERRKAIREAHLAAPTRSAFVSTEESEDHHTTTSSEEAYWGARQDQDRRAGSYPRSGDRPRERWNDNRNAERQPNGVKTQRIRDDNAGYRTQHGNVGTERRPQDNRYDKPQRRYQPWQDRRPFHQNDRGNGRRYASYRRRNGYDMDRAQVVWEDDEDRDERIDELVDEGYTLDMIGGDPENDDEHNLVDPTVN